MEFTCAHLVLPVLLLLTTCRAQSQEKCVFQMDANSNRVKITCGHGAVLNIVDQHGNVLLSGETSSKAETPLVFQLNRSDISSLNDETAKAIKKLNDASKLLRKVRDDLNLQSTNNVNLTSLLNKGDEELKKDFDNLRRHELSSPLVREAFIAALQNQYNYLRMGLLTQNIQLNELIRTTTRLTSSIMKTVRGARGMGDILDLRADVMNDTLRNITKRMPGGGFFGESTVLYQQTLKKIIPRSTSIVVGMEQGTLMRDPFSQNDKKCDIYDLTTLIMLCPQTLKKIIPRGTSIVVGVEQGTLMRDPFSQNDKMWVMYGFTNLNEVIQYDSLKGLKFEMVEKTLKLPFSCVGTGHVVYKQVLYCHRMFTNKIVSYDLAENRMLRERAVDGVSDRETHPYQSRKFSDLDFAVDETGLWLIYATNTSKGNIIIAKVNEEDLNFHNSWHTNIPKVSIGNAFVICGILYAVDSYEDVPTYVRYVFDTADYKEREIGPDILPFRNSASGDYARVYSLDYSPGDKALFSWNNGRIEIFPVSFSDENEP